MPDRPGGDDPGRGRRLGLDVGTVRIGVSLSDPDGILATPLETVQADKTSGAWPGEEFPRILELVAENFVVEVVVGLPVSLRSHRTASTRRAENYATRLRRELDIPVRLVDERMSTMAATNAMHASGVSQKKGRSRIDQAAAVHILQGWLDARRAFAARYGGPDNDL
ncbi:Holliday junction resolvase RuvX [uncultured Corynebacterium sp.]|uniref:Holliday junction resolvase RuvX n=1 Tax=uncultured Corynebacterium sp. TaxID=159447 RepID=UPI0025E79AD9|nr:Holliday junction resolvase RuvX [uncultured Corynebacterium sp.]